MGLTQPVFVCLTHRGVNDAIDGDVCAGQFCADRGHGSMTSTR